MKKFPRMYSLSTLGIRQHQEFDYEFHGFRTDFVGDSGCGKSMIADLVQLVFVGSEVFASGTDSMDKREVEGMVLRTIGAKGTDMAYVVLNIQLSHNQFIAIGAYLESTNRHSRSFVIQSGYQESELKALSRPLTVADIHANEQIPTMDIFKESLEGKGLILHAFPQRKRFHGFLFRHQLLSIDLSQSNRILREYALIIQSFSRGKSLDISDSNSLKRFLFGDEKAKEITQRYTAAVEELQLTLKEHAQNREEIKLATQKHHALSALGELKSNLDLNEKNFLLKRCAYTVQQEEEASKSLRESAIDYIDAYSVLSATSEIVEQEMTSSNDTAEQLRLQEESAKKYYNRTYSLQEKLNPFLSLQDNYDCSLKELTQIFSQYQKDKVDLRILSEINSSLEKNDLKDLLETYLPFGDLTRIIERLENDNQELSTQLGQKEQLLAFADLNNEGSLGYWAINNYQAYSLEVESLLIFYKDLPIHNPQKKQDRYVPIPENLLKESLSFTKEDEGFWVDAGGINQYIPYQKSQLFASSNPQALKTLLASLSKNLHQEISILKAEINGLKSLKSYILSTPDFNSFLSVRHREEELAEFINISQLDLSQQTFDEGLLLLKDASQIQVDYQHANDDWNDKRKALSRYTAMLQNLEKSQVSLENLLSATIVHDIIKTLEKLFPELNNAIANQNQQLVYLKSRFEKSTAKDVFISEMLRDNQQKMGLQDINRQHQEFNDYKGARENAFKEARLMLVGEPDISIYASQIIERPDEEEKAYDVSKRLYQTKFDDIIDIYIPAESYRFTHVKNYDELCTTVLPDAFLDQKIQKESSIETIWNYLTTINDKNKSLNNRKLYKIRDILDEVGDELSKREDTVRQIHNFLDNGDREITGGHRVSLKTSSQHAYPRTWINGYIDKLSTDSTLFAEGDTLHELLGDSVSLEEKMINAFHAFGGHRGTKPKIETLLDPNSYFDLTFKMESHVSGKTNIGSTGQVYAAIALLCIARLSLVNKSSFNKNPPPGIRFMPIDEAEGLGSNFDLLYEIARDFDYQILTMGIKPLGRFKDGEQYIYMLSNNKEVPEDVNYQPYAVFCEADQQF